jgi:hypothetical protein
VNYVVIYSVAVVSALNKMLRLHWFVVKLDWLRNLPVVQLLGSKSHSLVRNVAFIMVANSSSDRYHITLSSTNLVFMTFDHFFSSNNLSVLALVARLDLPKVRAFINL